ncbi:DNA-protecting protein DprA [Candidatus Woesebacteria bacterium]|nr:DNA-protecting protein DprA [Candidatus Woesebacteria bacterium]
MTEREAWLAFSTFIPMGPVRFNLLVEYYKTALAAWKAPTTEFHKLGLSSNIIVKFEAHRRNFDVSAYAQELERLKVNYVTLFDKEYPQNLKEIQGGPFVLYYKGNIEICNCLSIAVVGSRKITPYGREVAEKFSKELALLGVVIISGLARGIDTVAHESTLSAGGKAVAVIGSGLNNIYPPENTNLAEEIIKKGGVLISEYPLGFPALPTNFTARNRIISGLSHGVLIVEGAEKSGTLLTAKHAADQGREVFAIPGQINSPNSWAPHFLVKQGAKITTCVADITESLGIEAMIDPVFSK